MNDKIIEQATKTMHAEVCCPCDPQGCDWTHTREARYARALADAGLLTQPGTTRAEAWDEGANSMRDIYGDTVEHNPYRHEHT